MNVKYIIPSILTLTLAVACAKAPAGDGERVKVCAVVADADATRAATPYEATIPDADHPLAANVWFSTDGSTFPASGTVNGSTVSLHRTVTYTDGSYVFPSLDAGEYLKYPTNGDPLYCIGLYPQSGWSTTDGTTASHTIDTNTDLMFAPRTSGTKSSLMGRQTYRHLLTWIKVRAHATNSSAISSWGNLRSISIDSKPTVSVTLVDGTVEFTGSGTTNVFSGDQALTITSTEVGSIFCSPVIATDGGNEYTLHVICDNYSRDIAITLIDESMIEFVGDTSGKLFVINLNFAAFTVIDADCTLSAWADNNENLYPDS